MFNVVPGFLPTAEGPRPVGPLCEGDPETPPPHHDHDADGSLTTGTTAQMTRFILKDEV